MPNSHPDLRIESLPLPQQKDQRLGWGVVAKLPQLLRVSCRFGKAASEQLRSECRRAYKAGGHSVSLECAGAQKLDYLPKPSWRLLRATLAVELKWGESERRPPGQPPETSRQGVVEVAAAIANLPDFAKHPKRDAEI